MTSATLSDRDYFIPLRARLLIPATIHFEYVFNDFLYYYTFLLFYTLHIIILYHVYKLLLSHYSRLLIFRVHLNVVKNLISAKCDI